MLRRIIIFLLLASHILFAKNWTNYTTSNSGLSHNVVRAVAIDAAGNKWFGTEDGLCVFTGKKWITFKKENKTQTLADNFINDIAFEFSEMGPELWIATNNGVSVMGINSLDAVTTATPYRTDNTGLIANTVLAASIDTLLQERWFGTPKGVSVFNGSSWISYTTETEVALAHDYVTSIGIDANEGWKYIGTDGNGVSRLKTRVDGMTSASPYDYAWSGLLSPKIHAVFVDVDGSQWYGTEDGYAYHDTTETKAGWDVFSTLEGLADPYVHTITKDKKGVIWVGTKSGLSSMEYELGEWGVDSYQITNYSTNDSLTGNEVYDIAVDTDGSLWIGTNNGISHFNANAEAPPLPNEYALLQNFPNPFKLSTTITYTLPSPAHVELKIYNARGQIVHNLMNKNQDQGEHNLTWDGGNMFGKQLPTGIYFAVINISSAEKEYYSNIKMVLVR